MATFGQDNPKLTKAVKRVARESVNVIFVPHAEQEMENDGFDHDDVLTCLRRGTAYGPEPHGNRGETRANVVHRNLNIRVAIGGLDEVNEDWDALASIVVVSAMKVT